MARLATNALCRLHIAITSNNTLSLDRTRGRVELSIMLKGWAWGTHPPYPGLRNRQTFHFLLGTSHGTCRSRGRIRGLKGRHNSNDANGTRDKNARLSRSRRVIRPNIHHCHTGAYPGKSDNIFLTTRPYKRSNTSHRKRVERHRSTRMPHPRVRPCGIPEPTPKDPLPSTRAILPARPHERNLRPGYTAPQYTPPRPRAIQSRCQRPYQLHQASQEGWR